ncbi:MAG: PadR family transcriptional regulator [Candidatus Odinarchaeia archaeon]
MIPPKGFLIVYVLQLLKNGPKTGYELIKEIKLKTGFWKPSTGSIYPLLQKLEANNLVVSKEEGRRKVYEITAKGVEILDKLRETRKEIFNIALNKFMCIFEEIFENEKSKDTWSVIKDLFYRAQDIKDRDHCIIFACCNFYEKLMQVNRMNLPQDALNQIKEVVKEAKKKIEQILEKYSKGEESE